MTMFDLLPYFGFADVMYLDIIYVHTYLLLFFKWENKSLYKLRTCVQKHDQVVLPNMPYLFDDDYVCFPCFHQNFLDRNHILSWIFDILCIPRLYLTPTINSSICCSSRVLSTASPSPILIIIGDMGKKLSYILRF